MAHGAGREDVVRIPDDLDAEGLADAQQVAHRYGGERSGDPEDQGVAAAQLRADGGPDRPIVRRYSPGPTKSGTGATETPSPSTRVQPGSTAATALVRATIRTESKTPR